jgi:hypothetical protein
MTVRELAATHGEHEPKRNDETEGINTSTRGVGRPESPLYEPD